MKNLSSTQMKGLNKLYSEVRNEFNGLTPPEFKELKSKAEELEKKGYNIPKPIEHYINTCVVLSRPETPPRFLD